MNCQSFVEIVFELADARAAGATALSAGVRRAALAHALVCGNCAARLQAARSLDEALTCVAEATEQETAPLRLKGSLLAAFGQTHASAPAAVAAPSLLRHRPSRWRNWLPQFNWTVGAAWAAAAIVLAVSLAALLARQSSKTNQPPQAIASTTPTPAPASTLNSAKPVPSNPPIVASTAGQSARPAHARRPHQAHLTTASMLAQTDTRSPVTTTTDDATTGYIPLTYTTTAPQSGMVVRVEVPRASLLAMGLPVNAERATGNVKADVLMGMDGVALAIKLVNEGGGR